MKKLLSIVFIIFTVFAFGQNRSMAYNLSLRQDIFTPAFQLLWNDFRDFLSVKFVNFKGRDPKVARTLNASIFTSDYISDNAYYKIVAPKSYELKAKIQRDIFEKFGEQSKLLDEIDWAQSGIDEYLFYALLKKSVEFPTEYEVLNSMSFNGSKEEVKYFGVKNNQESYAAQIKPLFYAYDWDYAVSLETKSGDRVILYRTNSPENVYDLYAQLDKKTNQSLKFGDSDKLIVPFISLNERIEYDKLCDRKIVGTKYVIARAIEDVEFNLDNKGALLRNEAIMHIMKTSMPLPGRGKTYDFSKPFVLYMVEKNKSLPYFAIRINDTRFLVK